MEEMHKKSQLSPGVVCVLYVYVCGREYALCSIICGSIYEFVLNLSTSVLQQRAVGLMSLVL